MGWAEQIDPPQVCPDCGVLLRSELAGDRCPACGHIEPYGEVAFPGDGDDLPSIHGG